MAVDEVTIYFREYFRLLDYKNIEEFDNFKNDHWIMADTQQEEESGISKSRSAIVSGSHVNSQDETDRISYIKRGYSTIPLKEGLNAAIFKRETKESQKLVLDRCLSEIDILLAALREKTIYDDKYPFISQNLIKLKSDLLDKYKYLFDTKNKTASDKNSNLNLEADLPRKQVLSVSFVENLLKFEIEDEFLFDKTKEYDKLKKNILYFITGNFEKISPPLNFTIEKKVAYYLIHSIKKYSTFQLRDIKNVTILGTSFSANNCSKTASDIEANPDKSAKRFPNKVILYEVNRLIQNNLERK